MALLADLFLEIKLSNIGQPFITAEKLWTKFGDVEIVVAGRREAMKTKRGWRSDERHDAAHLLWNSHRCSDGF